MSLINEEKTSIFKFLIIGDTNSGKTSILIRYYDDVFSNARILNNIDFKIKTLITNNIEIKLQIWDSSSQEKFHLINNIFFRGANGIIVVYDVTNRESFNNVRKWMEILPFYSSDAISFIVGNKVDLDDEREVTYEEGIILANEYKTSFLETSDLETINI